MSTMIEELDDAQNKIMLKEKLNEKLKDIVLVEHSNQYYDTDEEVRSVCLRRAEKLLESGADPNYRVARNFFKSDVLLHITSQVPMAKVLLKHGANPDAKGDMKDTPLHRAIEKGKGRDMVKLLLESGASVDSYNKWFQTPLYTAMLNRQAVIATELLSHKADLYKCARISALELYKEQMSNLCEANGDPGYIRFKHRRLYEDTFGVATCQQVQVKHVQECLDELRKMEGVVCDGRVSLLNFFVHPAARRKWQMRELKRTWTSLFPIYAEMLEAAAQKVVKETNELLRKMESVQVFVCVGDECSILDFDSTCSLARFLTYDGINNLYLAFVDLDPKEVQRARGIEKQCDAIKDSTL